MAANRRPELDLRRDIPSLGWEGTYEVQIWIDRVRVPTPGSPGGKVKFDIK